MNNILIFEFSDFSPGLKGTDPFFKKYTRLCLNL